MKKTTIIIDDEDYDENRPIEENLSDLEDSDDEDDDSVPISSKITSFVKTSAKQPVEQAEVVSEKKDEEEEDDNILMYFKTTQCLVMKTLLETLKEILKDTLITFDQKGIKILAIDSRKIAIVHCRLDAEKFDSFSLQCDKVTIGVNMKSLFTLLKSINNNKTLTWFIEKDNTSILNIHIENSDNNSITKYQYKLLDINEEIFELPEETFDYILTLPSVDFQNTCRDMQSISEYMDIKTVNKQLILSCDGDCANQQTIYQQPEEGAENEGNSVYFEHCEDPDRIVHGVFPLKYLILFIKATNLSNMVRIYLKNNFPIILNYTFESLGGVRLGVSPRIDEEY